MQALSLTLGMYSYGSIVVIFLDFIAKIIVTDDLESGIFTVLMGLTAVVASLASHITVKDCDYI